MFSDTGVAALEPDFVRVSNFPGLLSVEKRGSSTPTAICSYMDSRGLDTLCLYSLSFEDGKLGKFVLGFARPRKLLTQEKRFITSICELLTQALLISGMDLVQKEKRDDRYEEARRRISSLEHQARKAQTRFEKKSELLSNMSHEFRTPLTAVIGYTSVLEAGVFGTVCERQKEPLQAICRAAEHLKNLLNDILELSRAESGQLRTKQEDIDTVSICKQVKSVLSSEAGSKDLELSLVLRESEGPFNIRFDRRHLRQILLNLLSNAIKFTPSGGKVKIALKRVADKVGIDVIDTGVGIEASELDSLFERFTRSQQDYASAQDGTGLGLHLVRQLAELNGAQIGVQSCFGEGSIFTLLAPHAEELSNYETSAPKRSEPLTSLAGLQVLVVDDSAATCDLLVQTIQAAGGRAFQAQGISKAIHLLGEHHIDVAITDLAFPGEHGTELLDYIRMRDAETGKRLPVLAISACIRTVDRQDAMIHGADKFIAKPFDVLDILDQVREFADLAIEASGEL